MTIQCIICKHDADNMLGDVGHIMHGFYFDMLNHQITYPISTTLNFYICVRCADQLRKILDVKTS